MFPLVVLFGMAVPELLFIKEQMEDGASSLVQRKVPSMSIEQQRNLMAIAPYGLYGLIMFLLMRSNLVDLFTPVVVYSGIICTMGALSFIRRGHVRTETGWNNWVGGVLMMLSDSLIGLHRFRKWHMSWVLPAIILTYFIGQYLIVMGTLFHLEFKGTKKDVLQGSVFKWKKS